MPSSRKLVFTREAEADIREILQYTRDAWGAAQRRIYAATLDAGFARIVAFPSSGKQRDDLPAGLLIRPVGEHIVYDRVTDKAVIIRRVVHSRRDVPDDLDF